MSEVLIIDDNKMFRKVLRSSLSRHFDSIAIKEAEDAEKALSRISESPPFLVIMDIHLPGKHNGLELTRKIKHLYPQTTVVICTNSDSNAYLQAADQVGADYFISKSAIKRKAIEKLIQSCINQQ